MKKLYYKIINIPEVLFFIPSVRNGHIYFGKNSYSMYHDRIKMLAVWRATVHCFFSTIIALFLEDSLTEKHFVIYLMMLTIFIAIQEFYVHPRLFNQPNWKSFLDFFSWIVPAIVVLYLG